MARLIDYSRQSEFDHFMAGKEFKRSNHVIIGCGGVGFWLGLILALQGGTRFILVDGQKIEPSNLNRLPVPPTWLGQKKAIALRKIIRSLRPETTILSLTQHVAAENLDALGLLIEREHSYHYVWDCTDDARIQRVISKWSQEVNFGYRKIGYEGFKVGNYVDMGVWTDPDYAPGYRTSNACAATSALAAVLGLFSEGFNLRNDMTLDIKALLIKENGQQRRESVRVLDPALQVVEESEQDDFEEDSDGQR